MGNDYKKDYINKSNNDFGSFAPKKEGASSDVTGAKSDTTPKTETKPQTGSEGVGQAKADNASIQSGLDSVKGTVSDVKSDVVASVTGDDPGSIKDKYQQEGAKIANSVKNSDIGNVVKETVSDGMKEAGMKVPVTGLFGKAKAGLAAGVNGLKALGSGLVSSIKGAGAAMTAGTLKAGAAVGAALHVSATAGTAMVLAGVIGVTSIPVVGGASYLTNRFTQKTDDCVPEEYDEPKGTGGEIIAATAELLAYPEGTPVSGYDYDGGARGTDAMHKARDKWHPDWDDYKYACCCHSASLIISEALQKPINSLLINTESESDAKAAIEKELEGLNFDVFPYSGKGDTLKRGDILSYAKKSGGGHVWIYLGENKYIDGSRTNNWFSHWNTADSVDENVSDYHYYLVIRKRGSSSSAPATASQRVSQSAQGAIDWATMIANDDSYTYGHGSFECCICNNLNIKKFTCMPFIAAAYAHGANDPILMKNGRHVLNLHDGNFEGELAQVWKKRGTCQDLSFSDLQPGDVIIKYSADNEHGHAWMYGGDDTVIEAVPSGIKVDQGAERYFNSYKSAGGSPSKNYVCYYIGAGDAMFDGANGNALVADMTADDGCGGEMSGSIQGSTYIGKGMKQVTAANGDQYVILDFDLEQVKKLECQGDEQCYIYSIGYCDLVMGGKFRCDISGSKSSRERNMDAAYGKNNGSNDGLPNKIGGQQHNGYSEEEMRKKAIEEIKAGRPMIVFIQGNSHGVSTSMHWVAIVGWTATAGSNPKWEDLVCVDPAYLPPWQPGMDGLHSMQGFHARSEGSIALFDGWQPGPGQKRRQ